MMDLSYNPVSKGCQTYILSRPRNNTAQTKWAHMILPQKIKKPKRDVGISLTNLNVHYTFHCAIMVIYAIILYTIKNLDKSFGEFSTLIKDISYLFITRQYYMYLLVKSTRYNSIYLFYVGIFILAKKCLVLVFASFEGGSTVSWFHHAIIIALASANVVELIFISVRTYTIRNDIKFLLLKQVGSSPEVNRAFVTRALLSALGNVSLFLMVHLLMQDLLYLRFSVGLPQYLTIFGALLEVIALTTAFADINAENRRQRVIAIWLSGTKSVYLVVFAVLRFVFNSENDDYQVYYKM